MGRCRQPVREPTGTTGNVYKFGTSGGTADAGHLFTTVKAPATGLAIDPVGNMFASEGPVLAVPYGAIVPVDLSNGTVALLIASGVICLGTWRSILQYRRPLRGDFCSSGPVMPNVWQVTGIDGPSPTTIVYAETPDDIENSTSRLHRMGRSMAFRCGAGEIARIAPGGSSVTNGRRRPTISLLPGRAEHSGSQEGPATRNSL